MDDLMVNQLRNLTLISCEEPYNTIYFVLNHILLFVSFPTTIINIVKLLKRLYKTRSFSPAEIFLLQINFINVCLFISHLLLVLEVVHVSQFSMTILLVFFSLSLTARPVFILAICVIFYLAIVHPVTYMTVKTWHHWEWLVISLGWLYALAINLAIIIYEVDIFQPVFMVLSYIIVLPITFFSIAQLRALSSRNSGNGRQTLNPAKRKAFRINLSMIVVWFLYYIPRMYVLIYRSIAPMDWQRFQCSEGPVIILLSMMSEFAMPVVFLYSLCKLGV